MFDGYHEAYEIITFLYISFIFIKIKFIHFHSCVMFIMKSMNICNDKVNFNELIIQLLLGFKHTF